MTVTRSIASATIVLALGASSSTTLNAQTQPITLPAAMARLQANDTAGAVQILESLTVREPANNRAWRNLGSIYQGWRRYGNAIAAWQRALATDSTILMPIYNIGITYARQRDTAHAFEWLGRAKATRQIDMTQLTVDTSVSWLRGHPRYAMLLPTRADFDRPFVEDVRIIREFVGEAAGDQFGWIARNIGDVDGDRVADFTTSAPTHATGGAPAGRIYVYSTRTGQKLWSADGNPGDQLGFILEAAGDVNRDGIPDVIAGAPFGNYAKVYSGRDGRVLLELRGESPGDQFGRGAGVGDVNGDGFVDLLVGAPGNNAGGQGAGRAYVYSGKDGRLLHTLTGERAGEGFGNAVAGATAGGRTHLVVGALRGGPNQLGRAYVYNGLGATPQFVLDADETGAAMGGMFLSIPGDVDGDGVNDIYASDFPNRAKGPATGRVFVHSGTDGRLIHAFTGEGPGEAFGTSPSVAGDVDGDGRADLIVGAWQYAGAAISGGRAYLYSGDGRLLKTYTCRTPGDTFGFDAVTLGDVDGDRTSDFLITSAWSGVSGFHSGRVFIISSGVVSRSR